MIGIRSLCLSLWIKKKSLKVIKQTFNQHKKERVNSQFSIINISILFLVYYSLNIYNNLILIVIQNMFGSW